MCKYLTIQAFTLGMSCVLPSRMANRYVLTTQTELGKVFYMSWVDGFSSEYPDAEKFESMSAARVYRDKLRIKGINCIIERA